MADRNDIIDVIMGMRHLPNCPLTGDPVHDQSVLLPYLAVLHDLDPQLVRRACEDYTSSETYFPTPGQLRKSCLDLLVAAAGIPSALQAWQMFTQAVRRLPAVWCETGATMSAACECPRGRKWNDATMEYRRHIDTCTVCRGAKYVEHYDNEFVAAAVDDARGRDAFLTGNESSDRQKFMQHYTEFLNRKLEEIGRLPDVRAYLESHPATLADLIAQSRKRLGPPEDQPDADADPALV
jgi:hypothetical protein